MTQRISASDTLPTLWSIPTLDQPATIATIDYCAGPGDYRLFRLFRLSQRLSTIPTIPGPPWCGPGLAAPDLHAPGRITAPPPMAPTPPGVS